MAWGDVFHFVGFTLDVAGRRLSRDDTIIKLSLNALDLLIALVRDAGRLVTKDQLLARVWPDAFVEEGILTVHVSALRKILGGEGGITSYIETVPGSGYRFVAPVTTGASTALSSDRPHSRRRQSAAAPIRPKRQ
jgi:DNA-binding winged helix-turn-helix (wHTH) protein